MVEFRLVRGRKSVDDWVLMVRTDGWEALSFEDLLRMLKLLFDNEERLYPPEEGFKGKKMLLEAIKRVSAGEPVIKVIADYRLKPKKLYLYEFM